ncbi:MAG: hypothetical protein JWR26_3115 [Pedosphaera sp.]|nr:hypothetical protein [Pedosphaera sp.]
MGAGKLDLDSGDLGRRFKWWRGVDGVTMDDKRLDKMLGGTSSFGHKSG